MKSNYNEVINDIFPEYLARGRFDIDEVVDEVVSLIEFDEQPSFLDLHRCNESGVNICQRYTKALPIGSGRTSAG